MSKRTLTLKLVAAALATLPLLAQATPYTITHDGWLQINGELAGFVGVPGADVKPAAAAAPRHPGAVSPDTAHRGAQSHFGTPTPATATAATKALAATPDHMPSVFDANRKVGDIVFGARS